MHKFLGDLAGKTIDAHVVVNGRGPRPLGVGGIGPERAVVLDTIFFKFFPNNEEK